MLHACPVLSWLWWLPQGTDPRSHCPSHTGTPLLAPLECCNHLVPVGALAPYPFPLLVLLSPSQKETPLPGSGQDVAPGLAGQRVPYPKESFSREREWGGDPGDPLLLPGALCKPVLPAARCLEGLTAFWAFFLCNSAEISF